MKVVYFEKKDKEKWNDFIIDNSEDGGLLQSFEWGDFQKRLGKRVWRIGLIDEKNELVACCLAFKDDLALGQKTIEVYRGPIMLKNAKDKKQAILKELIDEVKKIAKEERAIVARIDFGITKNSSLQITDYELSRLGLQRARRDIQPRSTMVIDLDIPESSILSNMKSKHRYNVNLAIRKKVDVFVGTKKDFEVFWLLLKTTSRRDGFAIHKKGYYEKLFSDLGGNTKLYLAKYGNRIIACSLIGCFGKTCIYMHGASDNEFRNVMAPYLLQWRAIADAKNNGFKFYDFGGVESVGEKSSSQKGWGGITRFKIGFSPRNNIIEFIGLYEVPVNKIKYSIYKHIRSAAKFFK